MRRFKIITFFCLIVFSYVEAFDILNYEESRDRAFILNAFARDEKFLDPSLPPTDILDKRIIATDIQNYDRVSIYSAYFEDEYAGFMAYYIEYEEKLAVIQYLSIEPGFQKQHCAQELFMQILQDPEVLACQAIVFAVALENKEMLALVSNKPFFICTESDDKYYYYSYAVDQR